MLNAQSSMLRETKRASSRSAFLSNRPDSFMRTFVALILQLLFFLYPSLSVPLCVALLSLSIANEKIGKLQVPASWPTLNLNWFHSNDLAQIQGTQVVCEAEKGRERESERERESTITDENKSGWTDSCESERIQK